MEGEIIEFGNCIGIELYLFADGQYRTDTDEDRDIRYLELFRTEYEIDPSLIDDWSRFGK